MKWLCYYSHTSCTWKCRGLALASNKGPRGHCITAPSAGVGRRMGRKRQNKGSLTEQQRKWAVTTTLVRTRGSQGSSLAARRPVAPDPRFTSSGQLPPSTLSMTAQGIEHPVSLASWDQLARLSWLLVKINPVLAEPRTGC